MFFSLFDLAAIDRLQKVSPEIFSFPRKCPDFQAMPNGPGGWQGPISSPPEAGKGACDFGLTLSQATPQKAKIFGEYIRKRKMDKALLGGKLAKQIGK
jgi:hypothetical protein